MTSFEPFSRPLKTALWSLWYDVELWENKTVEIDNETTPSLTQRDIRQESVTVHWLKRDITASRHEILEMLEYQLRWMRRMHYRTTQRKGALPFVSGAQVRLALPQWNVGHAQMRTGSMKASRCKPLICSVSFSLLTDSHPFMGILMCAYILTAAGAYMLPLPRQRRLSHFSELLKRRHTCYLATVEI